MPTKGFDESMNLMRDLSRFLMEAMFLVASTLIKMDAQNYRNIDSKFNI